MKRLLRYMLYREVYRHLRKAMRDSGSNDDSQPVEPDKAVEERGPEAVSSNMDPSAFPADGTTIDDPAQLKSVLQQMDAYDFEHFVADIWERLGWKTEVSAEAADKGVDVIARKQRPYEQTTLIQAKRYGPNTTVGSPEVQQYASLKNQYSGVDKVVIVTTNEFTGQARELADRLNVKLVNGDDLIELLNDAEAADLVAKYLDFIEIVEEEEEVEEPAPDQPTPASASGTSSSETESEATESALIPSTGWHKATAVATVGWLVLIIDGGPELLPDALWGLLFLGSWILLPVAIYKDVKSIPDQVDWPNYTWAYVIGALLWFVALFAGAIYLWQRRRRSSSLTESTTTAAANQSTAETDPESKTTSPSAPESATETGPTPEQEPAATQNESHQAQEDDEIRTIGYEDERYTCEVTWSPDHAWTVAYGRSMDGNQYRLFVYDEDGLRFSEQLADPVDAEIANTGRAIVIEGLDPDEQSGKITVFEPNSEEQLTHYFNANVADCAITPDGNFAAATTYNPDCSTYVFDVDAGQLQAKHENLQGLKQSIAFELENNEWQLLLQDDHGSEPLYAIDVDGEVVWESTRLRGEDHIDHLLESDDLSDLRTAIDRLQERYEAIDDERDRKEVAQQLADTHWSIAKALERSDEEAMLEHLDRAKELYFELLPWYDGKAGVAKVLRKQGEYYIDRDNHETAYECFQEIERLEDEYGVQLLTEADEQQLNDLSEQIGPEHDSIV
ncbi:hypothetical protein JCM18237_05330 [Halorubrum luteum]